MTDRIDIDMEKLYDHLLRLCKTPGPTQACVKVSKNDPRIKGEFPIERTVKEIVEEINQELEEEGKQGLQIVRHMGNMVIIGGTSLNEKVKSKDLVIDFSDIENEQKMLEEIKKIPVVFGAHLDEITYIVLKKAENFKEILCDDGAIWKIMPICNPPRILGRNRKYQLDEEIDEIKNIIVEVPRPTSEVYGFRKFELKKLCEGNVYRVYRVKKGLNFPIRQNLVKIKKDGKIIEETNIRKFLEDDDKIREYFEVEEYLLFECKKNLDVMEGDLVIQKYGVKRSGNIVESKALDDRVGCIAILYAVKEMVKRGLPAKAILTSSEEGVPIDISWGRMVRATYKEFCNDDNITLLCDGMDGSLLSTINHYTKDCSRKEVKFSEYKKEGKELRYLKEAVIIPYTSDGKGGGDPGIFSTLRELIPEINSLYKEEVAVTSTDYSSRSYEVKIMDRWTLIGFVQWVCGIPLREEARCHNVESVDITQITNIIRTLVHSAEAFYRKITVV